METFSQIQFELLKRDPTNCIWNLDYNRKKIIFYLLQLNFYSVSFHFCLNFGSISSDSLLLKEWIIFWQ